MYFFSTLDIAWWFPTLLLTLDLGMLGYLWGMKIETSIYTILRHWLTTSIVAIGGIRFQNEYFQLAAMMLFTHLSMDRIFGYGLKYTNKFTYTHLQTLR